jgi:GTP:adenosylcobinamide-phosphate guanylyltransferase
MPDALVLAGGRPDPALRQGVPNKAFVPLCGHPMVEFVLQALRAATSIRRIALVGPDPLPGIIASHADLTIAERGGLLENVAAGLAAIGGGTPVLAAAADIPLLTPGTVDAFVEAASALGAEVVYGVVRQEDVRHELSGARKTFVRLREGTFTGGSLILLDPRAFARARAAIDRAVRARKHPWELARMFGLRTLLGLLTGTLQIPELERRAFLLTGLRARALICRTPEIALDVDTPEMLAVVGARLAGRLAAAAPPPTNSVAHS